VNGMYCELLDSQVRPHIGNSSPRHFALMEAGINSCDNSYKPRNLVESRLP
jgi:hypothetical protein